MRPRGRGCRPCWIEFEFAHPLRRRKRQNRKAVAYAPALEVEARPRMASGRDHHTKKGNPTTTQRWQSPTEPARARRSSCSCLKPCAAPSSHSQSQRTDAAWSFPVRSASLGRAQRQRSNASRVPGVLEANRRAPGCGVEGIGQPEESRQQPSRLLAC